MATIGYTTGATAANSNGGITYGIKCPDTPASNGTISSLTVKCYNNSAGSLNIKVGIYDHDAVNSRPGNRLYVSSDIPVAAAFDGEKTVSGLSINVTSGTQYWIAVECESWSLQLYNDGDTTYGLCKGKTGSFPDPYGAPETSPDKKIVAYATLGASGPSIPVLQSYYNNMRS